MKKLTLPLLMLLSANSLAAQINTQALTACSLIENDLKRLVCYDQVIAGKPIDVSKIKPSKVTETAPEVKVESQRPGFGLEHKNISKDAAEEQIASVAKVKKAPHGELIISLENNQVWRQIGTDYLKIKMGSDIVIMRGALNSFLLKTMNGNKTIRVKRIK